MLNRSFMFNKSQTKLLCSSTKTPCMPSLPQLLGQVIQSLQLLKPNPGTHLLGFPSPSTSWASHQHILLADSVSQEILLAVLSRCLFYSAASYTFTAAFALLATVIYPLNCCQSLLTVFLLPPLLPGCTVIPEQLEHEVRGRGCGERLFIY